MCFRAKAEKLFGADSHKRKIMSTLLQGYRDRNVSFNLGEKKNLVCDDLATIEYPAGEQTDGNNTSYYLTLEVKIGF